MSLIVIFQFVKETLKNRLVFLVKDKNAIKSV